MPAVLFDIDGTLTDTNYLHVRAWRIAFTACGKDVASARIHRTIGAGSGVLMRELIGEQREDIKERWSEEFDLLKGEIAPLPAAADLLRAVSRLGLCVVLATSSEPDDTDALVEALAADDAIDAVTSAGDVDEAKPSPEVFEAALEKAGCGPDEALVVGDTVWDVEAAGRCGLRCVTLLSGGISRAELEEAGAIAVYDDPAHLLAEVDRSPLARLSG